MYGTQLLIVVGIDGNNIFFIADAIVDKEAKDNRRRNTRWEERKPMKLEQVEQRWKESNNL